MGSTNQAYTVGVLEQFSSVEGFKAESPESHASSTIVVIEKAVPRVVELTTETVRVNVQFCFLL